MVRDGARPEPEEHRRKRIERAPLTMYRKENSTRAAKQRTDFHPQPVPSRWGTQREGGLQAAAGHRFAAAVEQLLSTLRFD
jgi:hypothetical protein